MFMFNHFEAGNLDTSVCLDHTVVVLMDLSKVFDALNALNFSPHVAKSYTYGVFSKLFK